MSEEIDGEGYEDFDDKAFLDEFLSSEDIIEESSDTIDEEPEFEMDDDISDEPEEKLIEKIKRIPWGTYLRKQLKLLTGVVIMLAMMVFIIYLSEDISGGRDIINPSTVLSFESSAAFWLILISSVLFVAVLMGFGKMLFFDKKEEFHIGEYKSPRSIWFFLLTISFLSQIFILLDVALINVYMITGPVSVVQWVDTAFGINQITDGIDRASYADVRGLIFMTLFIFNLIFPLFMFISLFTRYGRRVLKKDKEERKKRPYGRKKAIYFMLAPPLIVFLGMLVSNLFGGVPLLAIIFLVIIALIFIWWLGQLIILMAKLLRFTFIFGYSNIAMIIPIIFIFYALPALLWGIWDILTMVTTGSTSFTIYDFDFMSNHNLTFDPGTISSLSIGEIIRVFFETAIFNAQSAVRIIELDFIIIIGLATVVIGFAEGYTLFALIKSISKGVSIARTGRVVTRSAPRMVVISTRLVILFAWFSLLWDKFLNMWQLLLDQFSFNLPPIHLPRVFEPIMQFSLELLSISDLLIPLSILLIPFYFIISSAFKFLSVSIAVEKVDNDDQIFFLLISSAFVLIVTKIFADIASLPEFLGDHLSYLPISASIFSDFIPFISKIVESLESFGFFVGFIVSLYLLLKNMISKDKE
jgi:hypothetical protein